ncbi:MAG: SulP family inorganic anion transporter [Clostridia bacterium]|nr:SulP family inorganic anion transporter [Clostridia bacterium]
MGRIKILAARLKQEFKGYNLNRLSKDLMSGVTVAAVALPLALAFGVSSGADAAAGLITAIIAGFIISAFSGASYQISGPTGAMTAVLIGIVSKYQLQGVFIVSLLAGVILLICGILKLGKLVNLIPMPVVTGFTSGIAIIIALGQVDNLFGTVSKGENAISKLLSYGELGFSPNWAALLIGLTVIVIMAVFPKKWNAKVPSSLVAIVIATIISVALKLDVAVVGEIPKTLLPQVRLDVTNIDFASLSNYISPAITIAALGMIESLLCGASASRMKNESFDADQELIAQGIGNIIIPFFGGVPATAAIARTSVAIKSGCETRLTGIFHALFLLASMFLLGPVMSQLPLSALAGVLIVTAWRMNEWHSIKYIFSKKFKSAMAQFLITMICTVIFDLTVAIVIGVVFAVVMFVISAAKLEVSVDKGDADAVVKAWGNVFFANVQQLADSVSEFEECNNISLDMSGVLSIDFAGANRIVELIAECETKNVQLNLCGANAKVRKMFERTEVKETVFA